MILLVVILASRLILGSIDGERVNLHIRSLEGTVLEREWKLFGPRWWKRTNFRSYRITYRCRQDRVRRGHVRVTRDGTVSLTSHSIIGDSRLGAEERGPRPSILLPEVGSRHGYEWI